MTPPSPLRKPTASHGLMYGSHGPDGSQWLYAIQAGGIGGAIKLGIAIEPELRLEELQTGNALGLTLLFAVAGGAELEQRIHRQLAGDRIRGEWFHPTETVMKALRALQDECRVYKPRGRRRGNRGRCKNCKTIYDVSRTTGHCAACDEFAALRESGVDPFAEEAA